MLNVTPTFQSVCDIHMWYVIYIIYSVCDSHIFSIWYSYNSWYYIHIIFGFCRIVGFLDNWPSLEQWFTEPENILIKINAEVDKQSLFQKVKEMIMTEIIKKENKGNYNSFIILSLCNKNVMCGFDELRKKWNVTLLFISQLSLTTVISWYNKKWSKLSISRRF